MKKIFFQIIFVSLFTTAAFAQQNAGFYLNHLTKQDTMLSGWKMYAGDDSQFANSNFDDSKWQSIDLTKDIQQYPEFRKAGIIWLRLHLNVDSSLKGQLLAAHIVQYTASEVYLNNKLIQKYGTISTDPIKVSAYLPSAQPFIINLLKDTQNVIAVRVAYQPNIPYISYLNYSLPVFALYINGEQAAFENYSAGEHQIKMYIIIFSIFGGAMMILGFIYLVYFLYDKSKKVYLYYSVSMIALALNGLPIEVWGADRYGNVGLAMWVFYFEGIALLIGMLFIVLTIYSLFNYPRRAVFKILIVLTAIITMLMYSTGTFGFFLCSYVSPVSYLLEGTYVCLWAIRNHKKDAVIILIGMLFYLIVSIIGIFIPIDSTGSQLLFYISQMSFPIGMSFYFGLQDSLTNKQLRNTLAEVQSLSAKNLAQELEKQQLLANQNELLEKQVDERTTELNDSLQELRSTQSQLIQSEKMASLGELTAGIAHEIQNPLNFVNNFSEVSNELINEMNEELNKGDIAEAKAISSDIKQNLEKINHHGKRADAIVKGMLQHSQSSKGQKEPTDINALCDEYLRLSYHGLRAKDKNFNAILKTDFDPSLEKINIIPQDMGRVILNLITNAFYAVNDKLTSCQAEPAYRTGRLVEAGLKYEPTVSISTKKVDDKIEIKVSDNGNGIPSSIKDKIFQPFFTTKPTGQGTGLGLSLAYDIVKAHGGVMNVETKEGEGTDFIIQLPTNN